MELDDVSLVSRMINRDGLTIELLAFDSPPVIGSGQRRPMNQLGLTHLSLRVSDLEGAADAIEAAGGQVVRRTRTRLDVAGMELDFVFCTDPDGVRIELMDLGG
jgi:lactoylglutathione lyase